MASYVYGNCPKCKEKACAELLWDDRKKQGVKCETCATEYERESPQRFQKSLRFPYYNLSLGQTVTSRDHETAMAKKMGMVPTDQCSIGGRKPKTTRKKVYRAAKVN